tara:strand:+ start:287 stop:577 length:291 start_codon:yes stop_codon:yes gene_type:complete
MNSNVSQVIDGAGPITGLFVLLLGVAVFFIWRSLNKQMKKVDATLPGGPEDIKHIATEQTETEQTETAPTGTEPLNDDRVPNSAKTRGEDDSTEHE